MESDSLEIKLNCGEFLIKEGMIHGNFYKIPLGWWRQIVNFHWQISRDLRGESVSYHRFNPRTKSYDTLIPYQLTSKGGLAVRTDWQDSRNVAMLDEYGRENATDFFPCCTIHTHVDSSAFESGTDSRDEHNHPGWHITLGKLLTGKVIDVSARFRLPHWKSIRAITDTSQSCDLDFSYLIDSSNSVDQYLEVRPIRSLKKKQIYNSFLSHVRPTHASSKKRGDSGEIFWSQRTLPPWTSQADHP